jgi:shikimate O-hydroxycinnamoyltransferase
VIGFGMSHQVWDGHGVVEFLFNLMSLAQGGPLMFQPKPDREMFKARDPPTPMFDHPEYLKLDEIPAPTAAAESTAFTTTEAAKSEFVGIAASAKHVTKVHFQTLSSFPPSIL